MADFYHVFVSAPDLEPDDPELVSKFDLAKDWIRYDDCCWLVHSTSDAAKWYARLGDLVKAHKGNVFIIKVDPSDRQGWMPRSVWKWLREQYGE